jgi:hypothetical protein
MATLVLCISGISHFLLAMGVASFPGELVFFPWPLNMGTDFSLQVGSDIAIVTAIPLITDGTSSVPKCKVVGICK